MRADSPQWLEVGQPATPAEAEALLAVKALLPDAPTSWAWSNLAFVDVNGRTAETDVLLLTRTGLVLVELKGWHGRISGTQQSWHLDDGSQRPNPLFATDHKAKRLRSLLQYVQGAQNKVTVPFIRAVVVMHGKQSVVDLDPVAKSALYGLDGFDVTGVPPFSDYLAQVPSDVRDLVDKKRAGELVRLLKTAGFAPIPRTRMVGQYAIDRAEPESEGPTWRDLIATHPTVSSQRKRIRLYDVPLGSSSERRQQITRAAEREYLLTTGLKHPGVVAPQEFFDDPVNGPALVFDHDVTAVRLDTWLNGKRDSLTLDQRLALVRQLAEVLRYAHGRRVTHRALTPRQVYVVQRPGQPDLVTVRDWQTGREASGASGSTGAQPTVLAGTKHVTDLAAQETWVYLAPEIHTNADPDGAALDVYGLGALTYLLLTDSPPAGSLSELEQRLRGSEGLDPGTDLDGVPEPLRRLVMRATHPDARMDRTPGVAAFLADLDEAENHLRAVGEHEPVLDPLDAQASDVLDDRFLVIERLGSGSTGLALLVEDESERLYVLKVAHNAAKFARVDGEYEVLASLDHPRVVKPVAAPFDLANRRCLLLEDAGRPTLGARIRDEGRLTLDQLERYGADLLEAIAHLDSRGVLHRDVKPDNLGVRPDPGDRKPRLVLFDFSLSREPLDRLKAGTPTYLDPFLGGGRRPRYDRAAERFAVSVTLFQMATGELPVWGSGDADPASISEEVTLSPGMFDPSVGVAMVAFFGRALARDATKRFGDLADLAQAWAELFRVVDAETTATLVGEEGDGVEAAERAAAAATLSTPLAEAGLSARARSALTRLDVTTVGELVATPPFKVNVIAGLGEGTRREIQRRLRDWRQRLGSATGTEDLEPSETVPGRAIDALLRRFVPKASGRNHASVRTARLLLGLPVEVGDETTYLTPDPWPSLSEVARLLEVTRPRVSQVVDGLRDQWRTAADDQAAGIADELVALLAAQEGVAEVRELARTLLAIHGSSAGEPARTRQAVGLVRAVAEAEISRGGNARFATRRLNSTAVLALEPSDPALASAETRLDGVRALADAADRIAARVPLAHRAEAIQTLRGAQGPEGDAALPDERRVQLATAASRAAAVSSRGEIYPIGLPAAEAVRMALAGASLARLRLTPSTLAQRVRARFPDAAPLPDRPALDRLVEGAASGLRWDGQAYTAVTSSTAGLLHTQNLLTVLGGPGTTPPFDEVDARLRASLSSAGYLTLAVDPRRIDAMAEVLGQRYGVVRVDITAELLTAAKTLAAQTGVDWSFLLRVDAADPVSPDRAKLDDFVRQALDSHLPPILERVEPLLLTDAAPLGRYGAYGWLERLSDLGVARPAARWHLAPHRDSSGAPMLDAGVPVPLGSDGWLALPTDLLTPLRTKGTSA